jgi:hypothetical protein
MSDIQDYLRKAKSLISRPSAPAPQDSRPDATWSGRFQRWTDAQLDELLTRDHVANLLLCFSDVVMFLNNSRGPDPSSVNAEWHVDKQQEHGTKFRYATDHARFVKLQSTLLTKCALERRAIERVANAWDRQDVFLQHDNLIAARAGLRRLDDAWKSIEDIAHGMTKPYDLKGLNTPLTFLAGCNLDVEANREPKFFTKQIRAGYLRQVEAVRAKVHYAIAELRSIEENTPLRAAG